MTVPIFIPGQRWISDTEVNLGLGIVVEQSGRQVVFSFPAADERRTYAQSNAPVSRVTYEVGDQVVSADDWTMKVTQVDTDDGCLTYSGIDSEGHDRQLHELELSPFVRFNTPQARLFAGQVEHNRQFELRCETLAHKAAHQRSTVMGLLGARVQLLAHQIYIAQEVADRYAPRVLLADEVGLGKTIEAGLVVHKQLTNGRARRVLILVPENLVHQWLVEMLRRFNLHFTILDEDRCQAFDEQANPFDSAQLVLSPLNLLTDNPRIQDFAATGEWDLLVIDEAHHLAWSEHQVSAEYECVERLAEIAKGLLLLTATPEQLGLESHFARLRLLDPDRYYDLAQFRSEEAGYQQINDVVKDLLTWQAGMSPEEGQVKDTKVSVSEFESLVTRIQHYLGNEATEALQTDGVAANDTDSLAESVQTLIARLLDQHGTGRVLFRNTRDSIKGFPQRRLIRHPLGVLEPSLFEGDETSLQDQLNPERLMGEQWPSIDARVAWLIEWLKANRSEKLVVICASTKTAIGLDEHLKKAGFSSAAFHEGLDLVARDRAAAHFADQEEGAQLLICSEIGSEGRNFQFAHHLVLFDLPLNPDLLEQRIGRLDRIGQKHSVKIHVPYYEQGAQQRLLEWYDSGINSIEKNCDAGSAIFEKLGDTLISWLVNGDNADTLERTQKLAEQYRVRLENGRDRLLELNSCQPERAATLLHEIAAQQGEQLCSDYMARVFEQFGVEQEKHSELSSVVYPGDHMRCSHFPGLPEGGVTITSDRSLALAREDMQFLTWEHPMVSGAMDMILQEDFGNNTLCTLKLPPLKPGTLLLETLFVVQGQAPHEIQLFRYLPLTTIRLVLTSEGKDLTKALTPERLIQRVEPVKRQIARKLVKQAQQPIELLMSQAQQLAMRQHQQIINEAKQKLTRLQDDELQRLKRLALVNPNIRKQEIEQIELETDALEHYLDKAQLIPDALRVIIVV